MGIEWIEGLAPALFSFVLTRQIGTGPQVIPKHEMS